MRSAKTLAVAATAVAGVTAAGLLAASAIAAPAQQAHPANPTSPFPSYSIRTVLNGAGLSHDNSHTGKKEGLTKPDDLTQFGGDLFTAFQNGVGPQGEASTSGNSDSTIVEFRPGGSVVSQWDVRGKVDGLTANPATGEVIATVNEDLHSSLYSIEPGGALIHYSYSKPLPHNGGTDAISFFNGKMLVSASAPGTTGAAAPNAKYPAVYSVTLDQTTHLATARPYYYDEASARLANVHLGQHIKLALTDPDSSAIVPSLARRFGGDFVLNSQGDQELIFSSVPSSLWVLKVPQSVDDIAWATAWHATLFATDNGADKVVAVDSRLFWPGTAFVAVTPCNANSAPATCPAPPAFPANYLGLLDVLTGKIIPVKLRGGTLHPQGLVFMNN